MYSNVRCIYQTVKYSKFHSSASCLVTRCGKRIRPYAQRIAALDEMHWLLDHPSKPGIRRDAPVLLDEKIYEGPHAPGQMRTAWNSCIKPVARR